MKLTVGDALIFELEGDKLTVRSAGSALSRLQQRWKALNHDTQFLVVNA